MLLQEIVEKLDAELDRLHQLRSIVSEISVPLPLQASRKGQVEPEMEAGADLKSKPEPTKAPKTDRKRVAGAPRGRVTAKPKDAAEASALNGPIPTGPVMVNAATVAKYHAAKQAVRSVQKPAEPVGTLGSMIRAMQLDRKSPS